MLTAFSEVASLKIEAFLNGGTGLSIEALPIVRQKVVLNLLMQLKMVLGDTIADMHKVISKLRLFWHSPNPKFPPRLPNAKKSYRLFGCAILVHITSKCSAWLDLGGLVRERTRCNCKGIF